MLHVSFAKLTTGRAQQVFAEHVRLGMYQGHRVLQLIAEAEGTSGLIEPRASPHTAGQRLVDEPAVGQEVDGRVGSVDVDQRRACDSSSAIRLPMCAMCAVDAAKSLDELPRFGIAAGSSDGEDDGPFLTIFNREVRLNRGARIVSRARRVRETHAPHGRRRG